MLDDMKPYCFLLALISGLFLLGACQSADQAQPDARPEGVEHTAIESETAHEAQEGDLAEGDAKGWQSFPPDSTRRAPIRDFQTLTDFPEDWLVLSKGSGGFFLYKRNNRFAHQLFIRDSLYRSGGYGETVSWKIVSLHKGKGEVYHFSLGDPKSNQVYAYSTIEILDADTGYALQRLSIYDLDDLQKDGHKKLLAEMNWLLVPKTRLPLFPVFEEPNDSTPDESIRREEIDVNAFREMKRQQGKP